MVVHRVLFDIHKTYKQALEEQSGPFFSWLHQVWSFGIEYSGGMHQPSADALFLTPHVPPLSAVVP